MEQIFERKSKKPILLIVSLSVFLLSILLKVYFMTFICLIFSAYQGFLHYKYIHKSNEKAIILNKKYFKYLSREETFQIPLKKIMFCSFTNVNTDVTLIIGTKYKVYSLHIEDIYTQELENALKEALPEIVFSDAAIKDCGEYTILLQ